MSARARGRGRGTPRSRGGGQACGALKSVVPDARAANRGSRDPLFEGYLKQLKQRREAAANGDSRCEQASAKRTQQSARSADRSPGAAKVRQEGSCGKAEAAYWGSVDASISKAKRELATREVPSVPPVEMSAPPTPPRAAPASGWTRPQSWAPLTQGRVELPRLSPALGSDSTDSARSTLARPEAAAQAGLAPISATPEGVAETLQALIQLGKVLEDSRRAPPQRVERKKRKAPAVAEARSPGDSSSRSPQDSSSTDESSSSQSDMEGGNLQGQSQEVHRPSKSQDKAAAEDHEMWRSEDLCWEQHLGTVRHI
eukprot:TRINITY_DN24215_c0_g1_i2.p1 TRINITY_DN24215_c0_g1~~TRINITY_DN24215_c0_g1_i2.p1  ORF type:complete len:314 (-),score=64.92 TRINITY_DN24215_c0_g1_i2:75-1016(-)